MRKVYLAGPIFGVPDPFSWRDRAASMVPKDWEVINPTSFPVKEVDVVKYDCDQIRKCDALLACAFVPSWGTAMEILFAHQNGIPVIAWVLDRKQSPWLSAHATSMVYTLERAMELLTGPFSSGPVVKQAKPEDSITQLLTFIGEDPFREGLRDTPVRVIRAWKEWGVGYRQDPASVFKCFVDGANGCDELVIVHNIPFVSKCEHHLADILGHAHVGYIPDKRIVGLSKLARLVEIFARRLQVQERATVQIADAIVEHLQPRGVGVLIRASHACMSTRGVKIHGSVTTTSAMRGALMDKGEARKEFMDLCAMAEKDRIP